MIIEFYGFPGSGKTTICNELKPLLDSTKLNSVIYEGLTRKPIQKLRKNIIKFFFLLFFLSTKPGVCLDLATKIFKTRQEKISDFIKVTFNILYLFGLYSYNSNRREIIIVDQGLWQAVWSIMYSQRAENNIDKIIAIFSLFKFRVVLINCDISEVMMRINNREVEKSRLAKNIYNGKLMEKSIDNHLFICEILYKLYSPIVMDSSRTESKILASYIYRKIVREIEFND